MHLMDIWEGIRHRRIRRYGFAPVYRLTASTIEGVISDCLELLNSCSAGTALYILSCLCPDDFNVILELIRLDLSPPHQHQYFPGQDESLGHNSGEHLLSQLQIHTKRLPVKDQNRFWLELTRRWLFSCPADPAYYESDECGNEMVCRKLRSELVERILMID